MPGKYASQSITVSLDDGPGGTLRAITQYVLSLGGVTLTSNTEQSNTFGDSWVENLPSGLAQVEPIEISGFWDTTATTGPHVVMIAPDDGPQDLLRTLTIAFGDGKSFTCEGYLVKYSVQGENGKLTKFAATYLPSGAGTWS